MSEIFRNKMVLILDDESMPAIELGAHLRGLGCSDILITKSVARAEMLLSRIGAINFAILEIVVHGTSSLPLARRLSREGVSVVLTSSVAPQHAGARMVNMPVVSKPYAVPDMITALRERAAAGL